jgi:hypothetical protein
MNNSDNEVKTEKIAKRDKDIEIAKITAFQATMVALIGASAGVLTTLMGTGILGSKPIPKPETTQVTTTSKQDGGSTQFKGYGVGSIAKEIPNDLQKCVEKAELALKNSQFPDVQPDQGNVWGFYGDYMASIRCFPEQKLVVIMLAGPNGDARRGIIERIADNF